MQSVFFLTYQSTKEKNFDLKIKHDMFPLYKPLIFCVKINQKIGICISVRRRAISCLEQFVKRKMKPDFRG